jgi:uncharacterized protein
MNDPKEKLFFLKQSVAALYQSRQTDLPFHGWHHIEFVRSKSQEFAEHLGADLFIVESAALVHDLNYLLAPNTDPGFAAGERKKILAACHYTENEINQIEKVILDAHTGYRLNLKNISTESMALSDADTLFKALPVTPIIFANQYILENHIDLQKLAVKVVGEQNPLMEQGKYFYSDIAKEKYLQWAKTNLILWNNVIDSLNDPSVIELLVNAGIFKKQGMK